MIAEIANLIPLAGDEACNGNLPGQACNKINTVFKWVQIIGYSLCGLGIVITGAMMAIGQRRGEGGEHAGRLGWVMAGCILIGVATGFVSFLSK